MADEATNIITLTVKRGDCPGIPSADPPYVCSTKVVYYEDPGGGVITLDGHQVVVAESNRRVLCQECGTKYDIPVPA